VDTVPGPLLGVRNENRPPTKANTQPFYCPFPGTTQMSRCHMVQGKTTEADTLTIYVDVTPSGPTSIIPPHFYAGCASCRNPSTLSWLGTGTRYAGLHT